MFFAYINIHNAIPNVKYFLYFFSIQGAPIKRHFADLSVKISP